LEYFTATWNILYTAIWNILRRGIFYGHLEYFTAIWKILRPLGVFYIRPFGIFYGHLEYFTAIWNILRSFGKFYDNLVHFVFIWYIFFRLGILHQEKSGNPGADFMVELHSTRMELEIESQVLALFV
jgi:hypothetical protein